MPSWSEVLGNGAIRSQKALGVTRGLESLHASCALTCWPMRALTPVVEVATLPMLHPWHHLALGGVLLSLSVMSTRGMCCRTFSNFLKNFLAAFCYADSAPGYRGGYRPDPRPATGNGVCHGCCQSKDISLLFTDPKTIFWDCKLSKILPIRLDFVLS